MFVPVLKKVFPKKKSYFILKQNNFTKEIFSKKLGKKPNIDFHTTIKENNNYNSRHPNFLKNIRSFQKCNSNSDMHNINNKGTNTTKIINTRNKLVFPRVDQGLNWENNKKLNLFQFNTTFRKFNIKNKNNLKSILDNVKINDKSNTNKEEENNKKEFDREHLHNLKKNIKTQLEKIKKENIIKSFFEDFIDISNIYDSFQKYKSLIDKFNEEYFYSFELDSLSSDNYKNNKFLNVIYKYASILIICLIFLSKDENLYNENILKMKELLQQYIYININSLDYKIFDSSKINSFIDGFESKEKLKEKNIFDKLNEIINLLFLKKMNEYKKIRKCIKQLANNIDLLNPLQILTLVNKSFLFCHNCKYINGNKTIVNDKFEYNSYEWDNENEIPFIKEKSSKKYSLIFSLNETIIHNMNLPFGDYFFVRPGFFDLVEKMHNIYEIIIFTSEDKSIVYDIIKKIDNKNNIDYILYKKHCLYENGNIIKKLELIGRDLNKIIYIDNSEISAKYNKKNLYQISSWYNNIFDEELIKLKEKLINIYNSGNFEEDITKKLNKE